MTTEVTNNDFWLKMIVAISVWGAVVATAYIVFASSFGFKGLSFLNSGSPQGTNKKIKSQ